MILPYSIREFSCLIIFYFMPVLIKHPTPLLPLAVLSKFYPTQSYPTIKNSFFSLRCVSDMANISGYSSCKKSIILYLFAVIPLTFTCIILITSFSRLIIRGFVALKYSSSLVCLGSFLSSII